MDQDLPEWLTERTRWLVRPDQTDHGPGQFVLYWMHSALRAHHNPALDVAICLARQNGLPLLIYHGLSENYPFASDRHHAFILQGARDVQHEMSQRGLPYVFHLQRQGDRGPHLRDLTRRAAVLVSEEMPVEPVIGWIERLTQITSTPIAAVDTSCVLPIRAYEGPVDLAYRFRRATKSEYQKRLQTPYAEQPADCVAYDGPLPFQPLDLQRHCIASLLKDCRIDHSVAPVTETPGGSRAGYQRWERFFANGLEKYQRMRGRAGNRESVSRLSAYFHYGMISPLRIAQRALELRASKYVNQLMIWRELAFHFCARQPDRVESLECLPAWAQRTLIKHSDDPRPNHYSWETLSRGRTDDPLWNACQHSLLRQGELHGDPRMMWGKAFLAMAGCPQRALQLCIDLNHRYALDGRDPASYGGILWCFGLFDRPSDRSRPIYGTIRTRTAAEQSRRLDVDQFHRIARRPIADHNPRVAIIGAGMAGLIAARTMQDHGMSVQLFDKSRGVGGRLATRRVHEGLTFDHGAQYFTAKDSGFCKRVQSWIDDGLVQPWMGRIVQLTGDGKIESDKQGTPRYVGVPSMNRVASHLASDLQIRRETHVQSIDKRGDVWSLRGKGERDLGEFEVVVVNCPPPQAAALLADHTDLTSQVESVPMQPCWSVMVQAPSLTRQDFDGAFVANHPLSWICRNSAKPGRNGQGKGNSWVLHASPSWSSRHVDCDAQQVQSVLTESFQDLTGQTVQEPGYWKAHRWRYAVPSQTLEESFLWDPATGLGACGDWCHSGRVEGAFLSGVAMAGAILRHVTIDRRKADCKA